jgi:hypothetical protein
MTEQEVYDTIMAHLRRQGSRSMLSEAQVNNPSFPSFYSDPESTCAYRSPDGKKCAAGVMITDEEYSSRMEGINIAGVLGREDCPASLKERITPHFNLISDLQFIHDKVDVVDWEYEFRKLATRYHLNYIPPDATDS